MARAATPVRFPLTPWTLIHRVNEPVADEPMDVAPRRWSLGELVEMYRQPLLFDLHRRHRLCGNSTDETPAGFVANRMVHGNLVHHADRSRGRFRALLLVALDRHVIDEYCLRRRRVPIDGRVPVDQTAARVEQAHEAVERAWAKQVLSGVITSVAKHCLSNNRSDVWLVLEQRVILPALDGRAPVGNADLAARLGIEPAAVSNLLVTGKRLFIRTLRQAVTTYAWPGEIDDEIRDLWITFRRR
jgi:hypothetical protein